MTIQKIRTIGKDNTCVVILENVKVSGDDRVGNPGEGWQIPEGIALKTEKAEPNGSAFNLHKLRYNLFTTSLSCGTASTTAG